MATLIDNDAKNLTNRVQGTGQPAIVRTPANVMYAAHVNDDYNLEVHYSTNNGTSWTADVEFDETGNIDMPNIVSDASGNIYLAYSAVVGTDQYAIKVKKRSISTGLWTDVTPGTLTATIDNDGGYQVKPFLTFNRSVANRLHLFYVTWNGNGTDYRSRNVYSDDYGSSWSAEVTYTIGSAQSNIRSYGVFLDSQSNGTVYFGVYSSVPVRITLIPYTSVGVQSGSTSTFGPGVDLDATTGVIDINDNICLAYDAPTAPSSRFRAYIGVTGTTLESASTAVAGSLAMGADRGGNVYVFYTKSDDNAYYRKYDVSTDLWGSETALTSSTDGLRVSCEKLTIVGSNKMNFVYYSA